MSFDLTNLDQLLNTVVGLAALGVLLPYLDRIRVLDWRQHKWSVVCMHVAFALWLGMVAYHGLLEHDIDDLRDAAGVLAAACWIRTSRFSWAKGAPAHTESRPAPLDEAAHVTRPR